MGPVACLVAKGHAYICQAAQQHALRVTDGC